jgi:phosphomannomutase
MTTRFGHDGWHGTLAREVTFDRITSIARSAASVMVEEYTEEARIVVGFDRRFMADEFARAIAAGDIGMYVSMSGMPVV